MSSVETFLREVHDAARTARTESEFARLFLNPFDEMTEVIDKRISRRKFLTYVGSGVVAATVAGIGYYCFGQKPELPVTHTTTTATSPTSVTLTSPTFNPLASYAKSRGLSDAVVGKLGSKLGDKLTNNTKALVDYLFDLSQVQVVSRDVLQLAPPHYQRSVVQSLQSKTIDDVVEDSKVPDLSVVGLGYLSTFPGFTQRWYIQEHGLDLSAIDLLTRAKSLGNQDFARYAVESLVCIQDHNPLTTAEIAFLENPGNKFKQVRDGYLAEMKSRGNPYDDFAADWRKMLERGGVGKEIESLDGTEDWVDHVLNSENPEVVEAELLKLKGGTPSQSDFEYTVPNYNTEQLVQYWLGKQSEYKRNDTLAQSIAMVNGLWITMGSQEVVQSVLNRDAPGMLAFARETSEIQRALGFCHNLEDDPLEAKLCWAWTGNISPKVYETKSNFLGDKQIDLKSYKWFGVNIETLRTMRELLIHKSWLKNSVSETVNNLEHYFYFAARIGPHPKNWDHITPDKECSIIIDGTHIKNFQIQNANFELEYFLNTGKGLGTCSDEEAFIDALAKSFGISTTGLNRQVWLKDKDRPGVPQWLGDNVGHAHVIYYEPTRRAWAAYDEQLNIDMNLMPNPTYMNIFKSPINQVPCRIFIDKFNDHFWDSNLFYTRRDTTLQEIRDMFSHGVPTSEMKRWLFYF